MPLTPQHFRDLAEDCVLVRGITTPTRDGFHIYLFAATFFEGYLASVECKYEVSRLFSCFTSFQVGRYTDTDLVNLLSSFHSSHQRSRLVVIFNSKYGEEVATDFRFLQVTALACAAVDAEVEKQKQTTAYASKGIPSLKRLLERLGAFLGEQNRELTQSIQRLGRV